MWDRWSSAKAFAPLLVLKLFVIFALQMRCGKESRRPRRVFLGRL